MERRRKMALESSGESASRKELLASVRRLTIAVLDNLEQGGRDKTLDQGQKRLLSSTGSRLLRLWRNTLKDDATNQGTRHARSKTLLSEKPDPESRHSRIFVCLASKLEGFIRLVQKSLVHQRGLPRQVKGARTRPCQKWLRNSEAQDLVP